MNTGDLGAMFFLGLFGTGHCIGMCGPLVLAFPGQAGRIGAHAAYHAGRIATYVMIGALMGGIASGLAALGQWGGMPLRWISGIQIGLSGLAALGLTGLGLVRIGLIREPAWMAITQPDRLPGFTGALRRALASGGAGTFFVLGLFLGMLPCGLSFAAFSRALAADGPLSGGIMLWAFGMGILPGLLALGIGAAPFFQKWRKASDIVSGMSMIAMAAELTVAGFQMI